MAHPAFNKALIVRLNIWLNNLFYVKNVIKNDFLFDPAGVFLAMFFPAAVMTNKLNDILPLQGMVMGQEYSGICLDHHAATGLRSTGSNVSTSSWICMERDAKDTDPFSHF